jgi:hypothetical protein
VFIGPDCELRAVHGVTESLAVGPRRAIAVDRVAPAVGDGGIKTPELFFDGSSVLGPYRLEKLLEQCSESPCYLHRRGAVLTDLRESERPWRRIPSGAGWPPPRPVGLGRRGPPSRRDISYIKDEIEPDLLLYARPSDGPRGSSF